MGIESGAPSFEFWKERSEWSEVSEVSELKESGKRKRIDFVEERKKNG